MQIYAFDGCIYAVIVIYMHPMNWDYYRYFIEIYRTGSLKTAAQKLGVNQTTVGRNLTTLEGEVGTRLFERRSDGFVVTAAGERILGVIRQVEEEMLGVERLLSGKDERPEGVVKIAAPGALANHWLIPRLGPFVKQFPRIQLEFLTGPELVNLARRDADIALRLVKPKQAGLVVRHAGTMKLGIFSHRKLFEKSPVPRKISDLHSFPFIGLYPDATSAPEYSLLKSLKGSARIAMRSAAWSSVSSAVLGGLGLGILPTFMAQGKDDLIQILPETMVTMPVWLVYHPDLRNAARVRAVIGFVGALLKSQPMWVRK